jgi:hypothetical protein
MLEDTSGALEEQHKPTHPNLLQGSRWLPRSCLAGGNQTPYGPAGKVLHKPEDRRRHRHHIEGVEPGMWYLCRGRERSGEREQSALA